MSRAKPGRTRINIWLPIEMIGNIEKRIPELGPDRTAVIETILGRFWNAKIEVRIQDVRKSY